ncbi:hypothetical protein RCL_jg13980.t1 [Rhizophagus clarus]|uniref:Uncharacterized protein n=1 Tax=Rhizophagus clarus TaxID=94130 RepID=A0A8H3LS64_9GLOM|nr:hypothetical protein RCL_jg13980.t1 [Rhizophagus clarus]
MQKLVLHKYPCTSILEVDFSISYPKEIQNKRSKHDNSDVEMLIKEKSSNNSNNDSSETVIVNIENFNSVKLVGEKASNNFDDSSKTVIMNTENSNPEKLDEEKAPNNPDDDDTYMNDDSSETLFENFKHINLQLSYINIQDNNNTASRINSWKSVDQEDAKGQPFQPTQPFFNQFQHRQPQHYQPHQDQPSQQNQYHQQETQNIQQKIDALKLQLERIKLEEQIRDLEKNQQQTPFDNPYYQHQQQSQSQSFDNPYYQPPQQPYSHQPHQGQPNSLIDLFKDDEDHAKKCIGCGKQIDKPSLTSALISLRLISLQADVNTIISSFQVFKDDGIFSTVLF